MPRRYTLDQDQITAVAQVYNRMDPEALAEQDPDLFALAQALGKFVAGNLAVVDVLHQVETLEIDVPDDPGQVARVKVVVARRSRRYTLETDGAGRLPPFPWRTGGRKRRGKGYKRRGR